MSFKFILLLVLALLATAIVFLSRDIQPSSQEVHESLSLPTTPSTAR